MKKYIYIVMLLLLASSAAVATVVNHGGNPWFVTGLSSDTKPVKAPPGSVYRATDTGIMYRYQPTFGWIAILPIGFPIPWSLDDLLNVSAPTPTSGYLLIANGSEWVAQEPNFLSTSYTGSTGINTVGIISSGSISTNTTSTFGGVHLTGTSGNVCSVLAQSFVASTYTNTVPYSAVTVTIPAGTLGASGYFNWDFWASASAGATLRWARFYFGGQLLSSINAYDGQTNPKVFIVTANTGTTAAQFVDHTQIYNSSNVFSTRKTMAIDTSTDQALVTTVSTSASDGTTITINGYRLSVCHGN